MVEKISEIEKHQAWPLGLDICEPETPERQMLSLLTSEKGGEASSFEGLQRGSSSAGNQWPMTVFFAGYRNTFLERYRNEPAT